MMPEGPTNHHQLQVRELFCGVARLCYSSQETWHLPLPLSNQSAAEVPKLKDCPTAAAIASPSPGQ